MFQEDSRESTPAIPVAGYPVVCDRSIHFPGPDIFRPDLSRTGQSAKVEAHWDKVTGVSKTTATLQVVVNPPLRRGSPIHDGAHKSLRDIQADYVRYVPWLPYPKLAVAELEPPANGKTSWDFSLIDPMTIDFLEATKGHSVILNFSTIPAWMFKTDKPVTYPADPDQPVWDYTQGTEPRDPTMKEIGEYYGRLFSWYTQGGFTDELGKRHESGYHYSIPYWEVLNEIEFEHKMTPETYTKIYDAVVESIRKVAPQTKFVGLALAQPSSHPEQFEYFLDPKNHKPGIPLDFISYHFYAVPTGDQNPGNYSPTRSSPMPTASLTPCATWKQSGKDFLRRRRPRLTRSEPFPQMM